MRRYLSLVSVAVLLAAIGCGERGGPTEKAVQAVRVESVRRADVVRTVGLLGAVQGEKQAMAMSKITGRVTSIVKPEGSWVGQDQPIAYVVNDIPGMDYKPGPVRSPISGVVGKVYVDVGQTVAPTMPVASVANYTSKVKVKASVSDQDLRFVSKGAAGIVTVNAFPDTVFEGKVTKVTPVLDQMSRTATVELVVDNRSRKLIPGMACGVELELERAEDVVALPLTALFTNGFSKIAVLDDDVARFREVVIGLRGNRLVEIVSGIEPGEKVITTGKERVEDGGKVKPVEGGRQ